MSSFSCPHLETETNYCTKLKVDCVPGRKGCILNRKFEFAVPAENRITEKKVKRKNTRYS